MSGPPFGGGVWKRLQAQCRIACGKDGEPEVACAGAARTVGESETETCSLATAGLYEFREHVDGTS